MSRIYVVYETGGEFDDEYYVKARGWSQSEVLAARRIEELKEFYETATKLYDERANVKNELYNSIPLGENKYGLKDIPTWRPGLSEKEITKEMRDERNRIKAHNSKVGGETDKLRKIKMTNIDEKMKKWDKENLTEIPKEVIGMMKDYQYEVTFYYEPLEEI